LSIIPQDTGGETKTGQACAAKAGGKISDEYRKTDGGKKRGGITTGANAGVYCHQAGHAKG